MRYGQKLEVAEPIQLHEARVKGMRFFEDTQFCFGIQNAFFWIQKSVLYILEGQKRQGCVFQPSATKSGNKSRTNNRKSKTVQAFWLKVTLLTRVDLFVLHLVFC